MTPVSLLLRPTVKEYGHAVFAPVPSADPGSGSGPSLFQPDRIRSMCACGGAAVLHPPVLRLLPGQTHLPPSSHTP